MAQAINRVGPDIPSTAAVQDPAAKAVLEALKVRAEMVARRHPGTAPFDDLPTTATLPQVIAWINAWMRSQQI